MKKGVLYVVATPIGNLKDVTYRAIEVLKRVSFILAEDTRQSKKLLNRYEIKTPLVSYRDQNHNQMIDKIIEKLNSGIDLALISDCGTPLISDPGYKLISNLKEMQFEILSIPGPSAVVAALSVSGLPTDNFTFLGFLPKSEVKRKQIFKLYEDIPTTLCIYESPNRLKTLMEQISSILGNRKVSVCKDLTKLHEVTVTGYVKDLVEDWSITQKGEFVVLVSKKE